MASDINIIPIQLIIYIFKLFCIITHIKTIIQKFTDNTIIRESDGCQGECFGEKYIQSMYYTMNIAVVLKFSWSTI